MDFTKIRQSINDAFGKHDMATPEMGIHESDNTISLYIDGDWYHDHHRADAIMLNAGYLKLDEKNIEDNDDDFYESEHIYQLEK